MESTTISSKGQIQIPTHLRKRFNLTTNSRVLVFEKQGDLIIRPLSKVSLKKFVGILKGKVNLTQELLNDRKRERHNIK